MNHRLPDQPNSDQSHLDALLKRLVSEPVPPVPGNLESRVWREIHVRRAQEARGIGHDWLARVLNLWREPRVTFAGLVAAAAIGVSMSWANASATQTASTQQALDLKVFSVEAPALPSTLLARADTRR